MLDKILSLFSINIDPKRTYGLDILRFIAISAVMYGHSRHFLKSHVDMKKIEFFLFDGVTIFFVLSGFLIGGILIKVFDTSDFKFENVLDFWIRRWFQTLPNYLLILTLLVAVVYLNNEVVQVDYWKYYLFVQNLFTPHPYAFFPEAWSLSIEEWFYILVPLVLLFLSQILSDKKTILLVAILLFISVPACFRVYRAVLNDCQDASCWGRFVRSQIEGRLDSLMIGVLGAYLLYFHEMIFNKNINTRFFIGITLLVVPQVYDYVVADMFFKNYLSFWFTGFGTLLVLPKFNSIKFGKGYIYRFITTLSLISYSMYLLNYSLIGKYFFRFLHRTIPLLSSTHLLFSLFNYLLFWAMTILLSVLIYKYYELPMTGLRDRFGKKQH